MKKYLSVAFLSFLAAFIISLGTFKAARGQFVGATQVPGFYNGATNAVTNTAIGSALAVTNPASNFLMLVQGGPVYCNGALAEIGQSTIQLAASNTYLIVANCAQQNVYAKTGVTGPGSSGTSSGGTPPPPTTLLAAIPGLEIPIATIVCNATACGNGGNGSITDARPVANFPGAGTPLNTTLQANLPSTNVTNGTVIFCTDCTTASACTGSGTGAMAVRQNNAWKCF